MATDVLAELEWRGLVHQKTAEDLGEVLAAGPITLYIGFDPTGPSLHVGHLLPMTVLKHFQRGGHRVIPLMGGATGLIGDPSFKAEERKLLDLEVAAANVRSIRAQMERFLDATDNPPIHANNLDWLGELKLLDFLRDTAKHFSVNAMIAKDSVRVRLERDEAGISFTEFSYALLQAHDFLELHRRHGCVLQAGGSDQWGNIVGGVDLIRRVTGKKAYGLTQPLLTDSEGKKFGKTESGAVFLDPAMTSPYAFYQFWVNTTDADVIRLMKLFTFMERDAIQAFEPMVGSSGREAQKALAYTMTESIHGKAEADKAVKASEVLFGGDVRGVPASMLAEIFADVPSTRMAADATVLDAMVQVGAVPSKGEARRLVQQNAVIVSGVPVADANQPLVWIDDTVAVIRRGKRNFYLVQREAS